MYGDAELDQVAAPDAAEPVLALGPAAEGADAEEEGGEAAEEEQTSAGSVAVEQDEQEGAEEAAEEAEAEAEAEKPSVDAIDGGAAGL
ncbi:unnamed protein product [Closterium sp. NIES-53]